MLISGIFFSNIVLLIIGVSVAYENIQTAFYGKSVTAFEVSDTKVRIFDFTLKYAD